MDPLREIAAERPHSASKTTRRPSAQVQEPPKLVVAWRHRGISFYPTKI